MTTDIELVTTALADFDKVGAGLATLSQKYVGVVYDVQTTAGMAAAKEARAAVREPRYEIERIRKSAKAPLLAIGKKLDAEAARITTELMRLEDPIDQQIKTEEGRKEREKAERAAAEVARVTAIHARIDALRQIPVRVIGKTAAQIVTLIAETEAIEIDAGFAEFTDIARQAHQAAVFALRGLHGMAVEAEAEKARVAAERAELAKLRAEQEARAAEERRRDDEARRAREEADREAAAKARAEIEADRARLAEERRQQEAFAKAEADRLAAERAELARQQEAARPKPAPIKRPSDHDLCSAIAFAFSVDEDTADDWLSVYRTEQQAA